MGLKHQSFYRFQAYLLCAMIVLMSGCSTEALRADNYDITDDAFLSYRRAEQAYEYGDYEAAVENFKEFVTDHPEESLHKVALFYLGRSYEHLNEIKKASDMYAEVIEKYKGDFWADSAETRLRNLR